MLKIRRMANGEVGFTVSGRMDSESVAELERLTPAWRSKPSWTLVAATDRIIEVAGASYSVYISHPKEVAAVIESAARAVSK